MYTLFKLPLTSGMGNPTMESIGRAQLKLTFDGICRHHPISNFLLMGPQGTGKSTVLNCYFNTEKRRQLAEKCKNLVVFRSFSPAEVRELATIFAHLADAVAHSLDNLSNTESVYHELKEALKKEADKRPNYRTNEIDGEDLLQAYIQELRKNDYYVTIIIDNFHNLTNSPVCETSFFSRLASLANNRWLSFVVATDYHLNLASRAFNVSDFRRVFPSVPDICSPLSKRYINPLLDEIQHRIPSENEEGEEVYLSPEDIETIRVISKGIPGLMQLAAAAMHQIRAGTLQPYTEDEIIKAVRMDTRSLMNDWVKHLSDGCLELLFQCRNGLIEDDIHGALPNTGEEARDALDILCQSGLLIKPEGRIKWVPNCPLFQDFLNQEYESHISRMEKKYRKEELISAVPDLQHFDDTVSPGRSWPQLSPGGTVIQNTTVVYGNLVHGDNNNVASSVAGQPVQKLLHMIADGSSRVQLRNQLSELLTCKRVDALKAVFPEWTFANAIDAGIWKQSDDSAEAVSSFDREFEKAISCPVLGNIEEDGGGDLVGITEQEEQTLERMYVAAKAVVRPRLRDDLVNELSPRAQFYLKMAVVVENALSLVNTLPDSEIECSAQLLLYGKALEQMLRDRLFPLFHDSDQLNQYEIPPLTGGYPQPFECLTAQETGIGNYYYAVRDNAGSLCLLCSNYSLDLGDYTPTFRTWGAYWQDLSRKIWTARNIRNKACHPSEDKCNNPNAADVNDIVDLCFESADSITRQSAVAMRLSSELNRTHIPAAGSLPWTVGDPYQLVGREAILRCNRVNPITNACQGTLQDVGQGYIAKISAKKTKAYQRICAGFIPQEGNCYSVRLLEYRFQDDNWFFRAEFI